MEKNASMKQALLPPWAPIYLRVFSFKKLEEALRIPANLVEHDYSMSWLCLCLSSFRTVCSSRAVLYTMPNDCQVISNKCSFVRWKTVGGQGDKENGRGGERKKQGETEGKRWERQRKERKQRGNLATQGNAVLLSLVLYQARNDASVITENLSTMTI